MEEEEEEMEEERKRKRDKLIWMRLCDLEGKGNGWKIKGKD